jgi:ATP-dependent Clp protease ATP-binding subunit ClpC
MQDNQESSQSLSMGAQQLIDAVLQKKTEANHPQLGLQHWLLVLMEKHGLMAETMTSGLEGMALMRRLREDLTKGDVGKPLDEQTVLIQAGEHAQARGKPQIAERDIAYVILTNAGYNVIEEACAATSKQQGAEFDPSTIYGSDPSPSSVGAASGQFKAKRPTPTLEQFGRDLTREAMDGKLSPLVGREHEVELVVETLCRRTKRNPVLVGPAGVGKTAIVEGLAQLMVKNQIPEALRGSRVLAVQPSTLVAGARVVGELEERMKALLSEASQDGIILFIDEVHSVIGAGGMAGTGDVASLLKPALARGDLACIAATTDDEYRRFIEPDAALERRFQPIRIQELSVELTLSVLGKLRDEFKALRGIEIADDTLCWLVEFSQQFLRNRYFPDKAVDLLEQCVAYAITQGKTKLEQDDAEKVAERIVGMPIGLGDRLSVLKEHLSDRALLTEKDISALLNRLEVTLRGLDVRPSRPNAVVLLTADAAHNSQALSETIAESLFGGPERVVTIDFSRFTERHDVTLLLGAPPGYVGYSDSLPVHRIAQMPWCVVHCENVDSCHPAILEIFVQALSDGFLTESRGKRVYLSDSIVLMTAGIDVKTNKKLGFREQEDVPQIDVTEIVEKALGPAFVSQCDIVCTEVLSSKAAEWRWLQQRLLADLAARYGKQGLNIQFDDSLVEWLLSKRTDDDNQRHWEKLVEKHVIPLLIKCIPAAGGSAGKSYAVKCDEGRVSIEQINTTEEGESL